MNGRHHITDFTPGLRVRIVASMPTVDRPQGRTGETGTVTGIDPWKRFFPVWVRYDSDGTRQLCAPGALAPLDGAAA